MVAGGGALLVREALINAALALSEHGNEKCDFSFPSFSIAYSHLKWRDIPVPGEPLN